MNFIRENDIEGEYMLNSEPERGLERMQTQLQQGTADISITLTPVSEILASQVYFIHPIGSAWYRNIFPMNTSITKNMVTSWSWILQDLKIF